MDPAAERIATVDERAKEQVKKAREYAASVASSGAKECEDAAAEENEAVRVRIDEAARAAVERADAVIASAKEAAEEKIRAIKKAEAENGDRIAAGIVREITEGAL
ncbi:MAG: hypothetical protein IKG80_05410 [Clostridia bacterium]|nr:hypothetical protein [Clostridia bacterium]